MRTWPPKMRRLLSFVGIVITVISDIAARGTLRGELSYTGIGWAFLCAYPDIQSAAGRLRSESVISTQEQIDNAERKLAELVLDQWGAEAAVRHLDDPAPVAVSWNPQRSLMDHLSHIVGDANDLRRTLRSDRIPDFANWFRSLSRRRLVIVGDSGTGKTTLAVLLLRELLQKRVEGEPVPVLVEVADFDPELTGLRSWLERKIESRYPALRSATYGPSVVHELIRGRKVLPIFDGLDEIPEKARLQVIKEMNRLADDPMILTCRTGQYESAIAEVTVLRGAAVIAPKSLNGSNVAAYLKSCLRPRVAESGSWKEALGQLRSRAVTPLADALSTPLNVWLFRQIYVEAHADPSSLLDQTRYSDSRKIREYLLDSIIPAVIAADKERRRDVNVEGQVLGRLQRNWSAEAATRWLTYLARSFPAGDVAWWQLADTISVRSAAFTRILGGSTVITVAAALPLSFCGAYDSIIIAPVLGLTYLLVFGFAAAVGNLASFSGRMLWVLSMGGVSAFIVYLLLGSFLFKVTQAPATAASIGFLIMLPVGLASWLSRNAEPLQVKLWGRRAEIRLTQVVGDVTSQVFADVFVATAIMFALAVWITGGLGDGHSGQIRNAIINDVLVVVLAGVLLSTIFVCSAAFLQWASSPISSQVVKSPKDVLRADLTVVAFRVIAVGLPFALLTGLVDVHARGVRFSVSPAVAIGLSFGMMAGLGSLGDAFLFLKFRLWYSRHLPWRLISFLEDAHRLGILRQVGPIYQFRHYELQEHLANSPESAR
jgi:hypothetical protein